MSKLETNTIDTVSGTTNLTIGSTNSSTVTFENGAVTGHMYPAFEASMSSSHNDIADNTPTKVEVDTEVFDTDNCYDNSTNYRFTPTVAGKYYVYGRVAIDDNAGNVRHAITQIYKNGSALVRSFVNFHGNDGEGASPTAIGIIDFNGSSDYVELYGQIDTVDGTTGTFQGNSTQRYTVFGAYRIGA